jgi:hypothetical protein
MTRLELDVVFNEGVLITRDKKPIGKAIAKADLLQMGFDKKELKKMERSGLLKCIYVRIKGPTRVLYMLPDQATGEIK